MTRQKITNKEFPHFIKYMGSKTKILSYILDAINEVYAGGGVCDLFAGSATLSGAIGHNVKMYSNDIQVYSKVLSECYLNAWKDSKTFLDAEEIIKRAKNRVDILRTELPDNLTYRPTKSINSFNRIEKRNQSLIKLKFNSEWHLFTKNYSGTWWSAEQCMWIDAIREVAESQKLTSSYYLILSCLMYAMSYSSQGTGHFAQYRDAKTQGGMLDIQIYRLRILQDYFISKYNAISSGLPTCKPALKHNVSTSDFRDCLNNINKCTVYADPPFCSVHYSRFYHALETLTLYDYPRLQVKGGAVVKGRYRENRHQSPFCIRIQVKSAFRNMFKGLLKSKSNLVLSYSNTGMITLGTLLKIAKEELNDYEIAIKTFDHTHMTMGRKNDKERQVNECVLLARKK